MELKTVRAKEGYIFCKRIEDEIICMGEEMHLGVNDYITNYEEIEKDEFRVLQRKADELNNINLINNENETKGN